MRSRPYYWKRCLWDFLRYSPRCGRIASRALGLLSGVSRDPMRRLALLSRAARVCPTPTRLSKLRPAMEAELARLGNEDLGGGASAEMPKAIILKPPVSPLEKGVLYVTFEDHWLRLLRSGKADAIAREYDLLLGPSSSPPPKPELLLLTRFWPGRLYSLLSNFADADLLRALSPRIVPIPLLASSWVNPDAFGPYLGAPKDYDIVMLAHFDPVKRHWLFFNALRKMPRRLRVLLMGVPLSGRTESDLMREARAFGVQDRFDLLVRPSREEVMAGLARARVSLVFSRQEGACIAVAESLFADTPVGLFRNARVGSKAFVNAQTGVPLDRRGLAGQLLRFVEDADRFRPRDWAVENISCHVSRETLNRALRETAARDGVPWTRDVSPVAKALVPYYVHPRDEEEMRPHYEDCARRHGLRLGPAARAPSRSRLSTPPTTHAR